MPCATPCKNCDRKGLPILFVRYAAAFSAQAQGMSALKTLEPKGQLQAQPAGVAMQTALYNMRLLRAGYLYLRIERKGVAPEWQGYIVHPHGYLGEFPVGLPQAAQSNPACEMEFRGANSSMVWVRDAKNVTKLDYLFHPDPLDYEHLKKEIEPNLGKYMQGFDVAGWAGGSTSQKDTLQPGQLNGQVVEFSALSSEAVRDACEPLMYGLMGSNAQERGWGNYVEEIERYVPSSNPNAALMGVEETEIWKRERTGPTYDKAHGKRLRKMTEFLQTHKGAVVACSDAIGICQELANLQSEVHVAYTHWQVHQAAGFAAGVTNEWVFQTAIGAQGLRDLIKKGAARAVEQGYEQSKMFHAPLPHDPRERAAALAARNANREYNRKKELDNSAKEIEGKFTELFDAAAAEAFLERTHKPAYERLSALRDRLGMDQGNWLVSAETRAAMDRYSSKDNKIDTPGGGASLSLQLAQCMGNLESHTWGGTWLKKIDLWQDHALSRMLCFNNASLKATYKEIDSAPKPLPAPDPETALADGLANTLKLVAGRLALGDKALAFIEQAKEPDAPALLRKSAWVGQVFSLLSARAMTGINDLPVSALGARLTQHMALAGMSTMGSTVQNEIAQLKSDVAENTKRIELRAKKLQGIADPAGRAEKAKALQRARRAAPGTRSAMLGGFFDVASAIIKGSQFGTKLDVRSGFDLMGQTLQGIGSLYDWRAKAYEDTIFKGVKGAEIYKYKAMQQGLDSVKAVHLKSLRLTAFKFLGPAAAVSAVLDAMDAWKSRERGNNALYAAQVASAAGTVFTIVGTGAAVLGVGSAAWATAAVVLGLVGAVLVIGATIAILFLSEEKWITWLRDIPLNKERKGQKPIHNDLQETLQELSNVQAELQPA
ncbi:T6SS effector BTH_I2691 family protein [Variovorax sp. CCNWLW225]|uniref:T6SS effector BTH_I2691 family protein n=1 Tax=Variovorax sp. CCNWLW225 TaxID=3127462 RepID=UPI0030776AEC